MVASVLPASSLNVVVVMPLRDDWSSAAELIRRLDQAIASYPCALHVCWSTTARLRAAIRRISNLTLPLCKPFRPFVCGEIWVISEPSPLALPISTRPQRATQCYGCRRRGHTRRGPATHPLLLGSRPRAGDLCRTEPPSGIDSVSDLLSNLQSFASRFDGHQRACRELQYSAPSAPQHDRHRT